jgi:class 3 adenylate cyclase/tetratricopeptide (TPR) repeat protein
MYCPECTVEIPDDSKFCKECGYHLVGDTKTQDNKLITESERKYVTILFSDLSGYTAMTERLDPEEVKEIMSLIFGKITEIIRSYDGFIERFIGDAIMAVFGVPKAHEDDPVRAIRAALEIHAAVDSFCPRFESKIGCPLAMHSGINTGLVVTGEVDVEKGTHGLTGDAINLASRLEGIAKAGEIIVGPDTYKQVVNQFDFTQLESTKVKGKQEPVSIYKVNAAKTEPVRTHRLQGLRAELIGRDRELKALADAADRLFKKQGSMLCVTGDAGSGKSRLISEFKKTMILRKIQWYEGSAYSYTQDIPYFPLINLLTRTFQIEESDSPKKIKEKIEAGIAFLIKDSADYVPYIGSLFSLSYDSVEDVSPEYWQDKLHEAINTIMANIVEKGPTVVCFEDLHWADDAFLNLLKEITNNNCSKALFICSYRSYFNLFENNLPSNLVGYFHKIPIDSLPGTQSKAMLTSLLNSQSIPDELFGFIQEKTEGNPFYLEEMVNSLIERNILTLNDGRWELNHNITEIDVPPTIQGVLSARVDRLENQLKRVLQEASVIGRDFLYKVLAGITDLDKDLDRYLSGLESLDLIRTKLMEPELEYIFKHALTQEVVYNGLLKAERQAIHERIGLAIEKLFYNRLPEFYETLAYHFARGESALKAVDYLVKSGEKSLKRYAVDESHKYYEKAFTIINGIVDRTESQNLVLIDLILQWAMVFYYRGDFYGIVDLLLSNQIIAESISDKEQLGMYYAWMGWGIFQSFPTPKEFQKDNSNATQLSLTYLEKAYKFSKNGGSQKVACYARTWSSWLLADMGDLNKGIEYGQEAQKIAQAISSDQYLFYKSLAGIGWNYIMMGHPNKCISIGKELINYGHEHSHPRCLAMGYWTEAAGYLYAGDYKLSVATMKSAVEVCIDPLYKAMASTMLVVCLVESNDMAGAAKQLDDTIKLLSDLSHKSLTFYIDVLKGVLLIDDEQMNDGIKMIQNALVCFYEEKRDGFALMTEFVKAKIGIEIVQGDRTLKPMSVLKNIGFILSNVVGATGKCETQLKEVLKLAKKTGAIGVSGQAHFQLGLLYKKRGKKDIAGSHLKKAVGIFKDVGAFVYLDKAITELNSIK